MLSLLGVLGVLVGVILVLIDKGRLVAYPLHFFRGLAIMLFLSAAYLASRQIKACASTCRAPHRISGIIALCLYQPEPSRGSALILQEIR